LRCEARRAQQEGRKLPRDDTFCKTKRIAAALCWKGCALLLRDAARCISQCRARGNRAAVAPPDYLYAFLANFIEFFLLFHPSLITPNNVLF
jgi:hypothetical protein